MRPASWGPVRPYQPPDGAGIARVTLTAAEYERLRAEHPEANEDCHIDGGGYYRRLVYLVEARGPYGQA